LIPYVDLEAQNDSLRQQIREAAVAVLDARQYILGSFVADFERNFAAFCGVKHAIAVNSGTSALHLALLAAGVGPGDEVITVPFTFIATVASIRYCGARPVLVDIDPRTFNMDVSQVERAITPRTRAILPVHLYGQCADMDPLRTLAKAHGLALVEDAAQAHGADYRGVRAGGLGQAGCFSFYPTKNLGACGEGGAVTTNDDELAAKVRLLRDWGQDRKYHHSLHAFNYRMEGIQGAILNVKLARLEAWNEARRRHAAIYDEELAGTDVVTPHRSPEGTHVYHCYTIRTSQRDLLQASLKAAGVGTAIHYAIPAHLQPAYADLGSGEGSFPESERAALEVLSLPVYPELGEERARKVAAALQFATTTA
jgi:dTDP-4-amino-4,6-dideoxygalactose transaminase